MARVRRVVLCRWPGVAYNFARSGKVGQILCAREHLNSLDESFTEIKSAEEDPFLRTQFDMGARYIRTNCKSVEFTFAGLRTNLDSIKSKARILLCWIDEASRSREMAWRTLPPTVRETDSRFGSVLTRWTRISLLQRSLTTRREREVIRCNYDDNPFPDVLRRNGERLHPPSA